MDKVNMCQIQKQIDNSKEEMMGVISFILAIFPLSFVINSYLEYYGAAEPPVRCGESHLSGLTEPLRSL